MQVSDTDPQLPSELDSNSASQLNIKQATGKDFQKMSFSHAEISQSSLKQMGQPLAHSHRSLMQIEYEDSFEQLQKQTQNQAMVSSLGQDPAAQANLSQHAMQSLGLHSDNKARNPSIHTSSH